MNSGKKEIVTYYGSMRRCVRPIDDRAGMPMLDGTEQGCRDDAALGAFTNAYSYPFLIYPESKEFECRSGENVYIEVQEKLFSGLFYDHEWVVTFQSPDVGRDRIKNRRLLLLR